MAGWSNVHLMFCEGAHDVGFLNKVLRDQLGFGSAKIKISSIPYPIRNVLQQSFKTRAAEDFRLDLAKKFFLPDQILESNENLVLIFNYGGSNRQSNLTPFLKNVFALLEAPVFSAEPPLPLSYVIFADADAAGTAAARSSISSDFGNIESHPWLTNNWQEMAGLSEAAEQHTKQGRVGTYIWRRHDVDHGTLEDIVLECIESRPRFDETLNFIDTRFSWTSFPHATPKEACALAAKRLKAAFCVEGQRKKPGGALSVILDQGELLTSELLATSVSVQNCVSFLRRWLEVEAIK